MQILNEQALNASVPLHDLTFKTTKDLINPQDSQPHVHGWIAQAEAKKAAMFGLRMRQARFNMLVLGQHGSGRTSLMQSAMQQVAKEAGEQLSDLVAVYHFNQKNHPFLIKLPAGLGMKLSAQMDVFSRAFIVELPALIVIKDKKEALSKAEPWLACVLDELVKLANGNEQLTQYIELVKKDVLTFLKIYPTPANNDVEGALEAAMAF